MAEERLLYNRPIVLKMLVQSPDLNPIENVWEEQTIKIRKTFINLKSELDKKLKEKQAKILEKYTNKIVNNIRHRTAQLHDEILNFIYFTYLKLFFLSNGREVDDDFCDLIFSPSILPIKKRFYCISAKANWTKWQ